VPPPPPLTPSIAKNESCSSLHLTVCTMAKRKRQATSDESAAVAGGSASLKGRNGKSTKSSAHNTSCLKRITGYKGFTLPEGGRIDCITMQQALDGDFVGDYVRRRRPVLIQGTPPGVNPCLADPSFLRTRCRNSLVKVESKGSGGGFGYGRSSMMKLHEFLGKWEGGEEGLYLTTQDLDDDAADDDDDAADEALPALMAPPLSDAMDCFPLRPRPVADLLPSSYNVWVGASRAGSSSGLHHDFHDNMYGFRV
jgi:hypothetical protein